MVSEASRLSNYNRIYKAVQYDSENGFTTWLDKLKKQIPEISDETKELLDLFKDDSLKGLSKSELKEFFDGLNGADDNFMNFIDKVDSSGNITEQYQQHLIDTGKATSRFSSFTKKAGSALKSFGASLASMGVTMAIGMALDFAITKFTEWENKEESAAQKAQAFTESINKIQSSVSENSNKVSELSSRYEELSKGVSNTGDNLNLTNDEYSEYKDIVAQLNTIMPDLNVLFNEQGDAIGFAEGKLKNLNKRYKESVKKQARRILSDGDEEGNTFQDTLDDYNYANEDFTYGWSTGWRDYVNGIIEGVNPLVGIISKLNNTDFGSELFGATPQFSEQEQVDWLEKLVGKEKYDWQDILKDSNVGDSKYANLVEELLGIDVDEISDMSDDEFEQIQSVLLGKIDSLKQILDTKAEEVTTGMKQVLLTNDDYLNTEDEDAKNAISSFISGINNDVLQSLNIDTENQAQVENWVNTLVNNILANKNGVGEAIKGLFKLDTDTITPIEAEKIVQSYISILAKALYGEKVTPEQENKLKDSWGFKDISTEANAYRKSLGKFYDNTPTPANAKNLMFPKIQKNTKEEAEEWSQENNVTKEELDKLTEKGYNATTSIEILTTALINMRKVQKELSALSFEEAWDSIGKSGTDEDKKTALEEKQKLEELAEAGKLTEEELRNSSIADVFKNASVSIEEATEKINKMKSSASQLASMKTGISSISSILGEKEENQSSKKTRTKGIGPDTLAGMPDDVKAQTKEYEHFVEVLGDGTSEMDECRDAADKLATAYVNSNNFLANLTDGKKDYYISVLDEMGVENAAEVVTNALNRQKINAKIATFDLKNATQQEIDQLGTYISSLDGSSKALGYYTLQQQIANNNALDTSDSIKHLKSLAKQCGITGEAISLMSSLAKDMKKVEYYTNGEGKNDKNAGIEVSNAQSEIEGNKKRLKKIINKGAEIGTSPKANPTSPKDSGSASNEKNKDKSKSTQQIDWISRALDRLSTRLDVVKTKYDNLFNNKKAKDSDSLLKLQNKNLNDQYKILTKTEKYQGKAEKKYTEKANSVRISKNKKENASLKKAVREGRINGKDTKKLIVTYGEKKAGKIQEYQDWYDKSQEQKKNKIMMKMGMPSSG